MKTKVVYSERVFIAETNEHILKAARRKFVDHIAVQAKGHILNLRYRGEKMEGENIFLGNPWQANILSTHVHRQQIEGRQGV